MHSSKRRHIQGLFETIELFFEHYSAKSDNPSHHPILGEELQQLRKLFYKTKLIDDIFDCFYKEMIDKSNLIRLENHKINYYFFGDIHGSLSDMILLRKIFWKDRQKLVGNHFIFMGDYVDRGIHGFEVAIYLLLLKLIFSSNFTIIRGNHEFPDMNCYSFLPELQQKFGHQLGRYLWSRINECFSMLPYAVLVCNNIFSCHGGFPKHLRSMQQIEQIPKLLSTVEDGTVEFQLVWNDFYSRRALLSASLTREPKYFVHNYTRGAGYIIGTRAVERFLTRFQLSYIVRAHDYTACETTGYDHIEVKNGAVFTLFSNSSYSGQINNTAYLFVSIPNENVEIFPLVQADGPEEFFNQSEFLETNQDLIEMKYRDPFSEDILLNEDIPEEDVSKPRRRKWTRVF